MPFVSSKEVDAARAQISSLQAQLQTAESRASSLETEIQVLRRQMTPEMQDALYASERVGKLNYAASELGKQIRRLNEQLSQLSRAKQAKQDALLALDDELLAQDFGLYRPQFSFAESSQYKFRLAECRAHQRQALKNLASEADGTAWVVNGSNLQGKKMVREVTRLLMTAYNGQCDDIVRKVKATNVEKSIERVQNAAERISRLGETLGISIPQSYVKLKVEEVQLAFEFAQKKEEEREAIREAREREREERKLEREIAAKRKQLEKERRQYRLAYDETVARLARTSGEEHEILRKRALELGAHLDDVKRALEDVDYREANKRAGYVYVISNIGSFGEGVFKIGMTRRLEPMDRIRELGDASVPFNFDLHALIFSDDAPGLEAALHHEFEDRKLNLVNQRREFFRASIEEIEEAIKKNYDETVEFHSFPDAEQWRTSEQMRRQAERRRPE